MKELAECPNSCRQYKVTWDALEILIPGF